MKLDAQFQLAGIPESNVSVSLNARSLTGNDILDFSGDRYRVFVWDDAGSNSGIAWDVDYNTSTHITGLTTLSNLSNVGDPDVCLIEDGNLVYAVVAYFVGGGSPSYYLDLFRWNGSNAFALTTSTSFSSGSYGSAINIDGNDNFEFAVTWDDNNPVINVITGTISSSLFALYNGGVPVNINTGGITPDICIHNDGGGAWTAHIVYINSGNLYVEDHDFGNLTSGTVSPIVTNLSAAGPTFGFSFYNPRIACPDGTGASDEWTIVFEERNISVSLIEGYNYNAGLNGINVYNDGTASGFSDDLTGVLNYLPAVAYDNQGNVFVGWTWDNSSNYYNYTNSIDAIYPLVLECDNSGTVTGTDYWQVPTALSGGGTDIVDVLSLAGRNANDELLLTYWNAQYPDILYKMFTPSGGGPLKILSDPYGNLVQFINHLNKGLIENKELRLNIHDVSGKTILQLTCLPEVIYSKLFQNNQYFSSGLYFFSVHSEDGSISYSGKLFFTNER